MCFLVPINNVYKKGEIKTMAKKYYTMQEIQTLRLYEMPNIIYNAIMEALNKQFGFLTSGLVAIFNNAIVSQLDQYIDLYSIIKII